MGRVVHITMQDRIYWVRNLELLTSPYSTGIAKRVADPSPYPSISYGVDAQKVLLSPFVLE
jgi:hypothetical protein